jgi:hypothetical protein
MNRGIWVTLVFCALGGRIAAMETDIPKPEHPRPDAARSIWANLNGRWQFRFDPENTGLSDGWEKPAAAGFDRTIVVPFPWESELSEIHQASGAPKIGWYRRRFTVPKEFPADHHVWLRFGAVDWQADVWVNGRKVVEHEGGYTPFEADITDSMRRDAENTLVVRAFDPTDPALPTGKQVHWYTPSSGIWQTVWLEARPRTFISDFRVITSVQPAAAHFRVQVAGIETGRHQLKLLVRDQTVKSQPFAITPDNDIKQRSAGQRSILSGTLDCTIEDPKLWTPERPHLYDAAIELRTESGTLIDSIQTYFGLRTIGRAKLSEEAFERILLNGKPVFLRAALDQSFNPRGLYTAPDDAFLERDMMIAKSMGLNALRIHIKPDEPRRLYWADRLGIMLLQDMPNTWRQDQKARLSWEKTMREAVLRDRNHPAIVIWVAFNETWGLGDPVHYRGNRDTQRWVSKMVDEIRALDDHERLVEDNSPCNYDHIVNTDINSWHFYIDNHEEARRHIEHVVSQVSPGSSFNYCPEQSQSARPLINSEYGAVSAGGGDRDISWGLRDLTTQLRRHRKIQGFVYTELSDIEWEHNGLVNYDRTPKLFGYDTWLPDMRPNELLGADFVGYDAPPAIVAKPGQTITVPVFVSHYSERTGPVKLRYWASGYDNRADIRSIIQPKSIPIAWRPYDVVELEPIALTMPNYPFVGALLLTLRDEHNRRFAANFVNLVVKPDRPQPRIERRGANEVAIRFNPADFARQNWTEQAKAPPGKVYGYGKGYFEYRLRLPESVVKAHPDSFYYLFEAAAKARRERVDWPGRMNRQDYPQTDATRTWRSTLVVSVNGRQVDRFNLPDDPADARGVLSHLAGLEHGSHGELVDGLVTLTDKDRTILTAGEPMILRFSVPSDAPHLGGLSLFGADTGELPLDPTLEFHTRDGLPEDLGVGPDARIAVPPGP